MSSGANEHTASLVVFIWLSFTAPALVCDAFANSEAFKSGTCAKDKLEQLDTWKTIRVICPISCSDRGGYIDARSMSIVGQTTCTGHYATRV